ncbi:MAG: ABC transporter ATP-binding protein [Nitrososphaera sp.]|nr:ABC transporter ATP-binding protein [Nitrososphaera sp.]
MSENVIIEVNNLRAGYDGVTVLHDINFRVFDGEFVSLIGKSGSGKSTLLLALAGFIKSDGLRHVPSELGMVFQNYAVFPWFTVRENITLGLGHLEQKERRETVAHYLSLVGLDEHGDKYPTQLSGGQAQRVAFARALAPNPSVIFMDEPFGALDIFTRDKMQDWLNEIWEKENKTVLFVTHNIEEAIFLSDRILIVGHGALLGEVSPPFARPRTGDIKYSTQFMELKRKVAEQLEMSQAPV